MITRTVTDRSVRAVAEHCPELQFVGFMGCPVTSQGVIHLTALRNLNVLDLRHISELNNETVMEVVRKCRNLSSLNLCLNWSINDSNGQKQRPSVRKAGMSTKYGLPSSQSDRQIVT
ncbi:hypothetical protein JOQ06_012402, partial [Pogonophryne albipinna]